MWGEHPRPALLEPGPHRGAPRPPTPARRSASLSGAPRAEQASAAGSAHCEYVYTNPLASGREQRRHACGPLQPIRPREAATGPDGRRGSRPRPTPDRPRQQRQSSPSPSSSSSISTPAELLLQLIRRAPVHPRAAALRPQSSRLDRQPAIFRVRRLPDGDEGRPCIRTDSEGGCRSSVRLGPQVRVRGEREVKGTRATGRVSSITPSGSGRR